MARRSMIDTTGEGSPSPEPSNEKVKVVFLTTVSMEGYPIYFPGNKAELPADLAKSLEKEKAIRIDADHA